MKKEARKHTNGNIHVYPRYQWTFKVPPKQHRDLADILQCRPNAVSDVPKQQHLSTEVTK